MHIANCNYVYHVVVIMTYNHCLIWPRQTSTPLFEGLIWSASFVWLEILPKSSPLSFRETGQVFSNLNS